MVRVRGKLPAEKAAEFFGDKLAKFDLDEDKHLRLTTDPAGVMPQMGRVLKLFHQLCHAHGLHMAVCDVIYKKKSEGNEEEEDEEAMSQTSVRPKLVSAEYDESDEEVDEDGRFELGVIPPEEEEFANPNLHVIINKVRNIVKFFRSSPRRNDNLQRIILNEPWEEGEEEMKELNLILDTKAGWSSLFPSLERYYKLRKPVKKALYDEGREDLFPTRIELDAIKEVTEALSYVEAASRDLCGHGETLASADQVFDKYVGQDHFVNSLFAAQNG